MNVNSTDIIPDSVIYDEAMSILADTLVIDISEVPSTEFELDTMDAIHAGWLFGLKFDKTNLDFAKLSFVLIHRKNIQEVVEAVRLYVNTLVS